MFESETADRRVTTSVEFTCKQRAGLWFPPPCVLSSALAAADESWLGAGVSSGAAQPQDRDVSESQGSVTAGCARLLWSCSCPPTLAQRRSQCLCLVQAPCYSRADEQEERLLLSDMTTAKCFSIPLSVCYSHPPRSSCTESLLLEHPRVAASAM